MTGPGLVLGLSGTVQLDDGRWISAEIVTDATSSVPDSGSASSTVIEIDAEGIGELHVRFSRPGDRFGALGAPGHKPVRRFMGERGVPREERGNVPLVLHGDDVVWVAGIEIADRYKLHPSTKRRVRLSLGGARGN
jgi:tRNA(Ile)-lysidine synthase